jgi:hypothetical protein
MTAMDRVKIINWCIGMLAVAFLATEGCSPTGDTGKKVTHKDQAKKAQDEGEEAPHGGTLYTVAGHKHHAELKVDKSAKKATVYLLDDKVKNPDPIGEKTITLTVGDTPPVKITLNADPQEGDKADAASRFTGAHDRLGSELDLDKVEIEIMIDGKPQTFQIDKD